MPPHDGHFAHGADSWSALPFLGGFLLLLVLAALVLLYLHRQGKLRLPAFAGHRPPEEKAKAILAERFARGDIDTDDFMERSSILNWTPGSEARSTRPRGRRR